jgi:hypothetical protein
MPTKLPADRCFLLPPAHLRSLSAADGKLVCQLLHLPALTPAPLSMRQLLETQDGSSSSSNSSSSSREPVLFITTPGADPSQELAAFAEGQVCVRVCDCLTAALAAALRISHIMVVYAPVTARLNAVLQCMAGQM